MREQVVVPAREAVAIPAGVSDELATAALMQGVTAQYLTTDAYRVQPGDWVVVHAAAGGTGRLVTQFVKLRGGHVLATTSTEEKAQLARDAGADEVVRYDGVRRPCPRADRRRRRRCSLRRRRQDHIRGRLHALRAPRHDGALRLVERRRAPTSTRCASRAGRST